MKRVISIAGIVALTITLSFSQTDPLASTHVETMVQRELPSLVRLYQLLHANPEISHYEKNTAALLAKEMRALGFEVAERVGKYHQENLTSYGFVAIMKNGTGPTVMLRTDLDGLPVEEKTGLPYASKSKSMSETGEEVSSMHACGHDVHMTSFVGAARLLSQLKSHWKGTLVMIGQPAEERGTGAKAMLDDGLYERFARPDVALALHTDAALEAGKVGYCEGYALANVTSVDITVRGMGGHGAYPHLTKDPVVLAAQMILGLQTIVSREVSPLDPAVVTVGSIHGGTKHNIIPDEVSLQLTVRSYREEVRKKILASIERIAMGVASAAGIPSHRLPIVRFLENESIPSTYNNPELTQRLTSNLRAILGTENIVKRDPVMAGEDFGRFALDGTIPICMFWLGAVDPMKMQQSLREGSSLPSLHSSEFAPQYEPTLRTGVLTLTTAALELLR